MRGSTTSNKRFFLHSYKLTSASPYSPKKQRVIHNGFTINWYKKNIERLVIVEPDMWHIRPGDQLVLLLGTDAAKSGQVRMVSLNL